MAASAGIAKRATVDVGTNFDQSAIDRFEHSLKGITHANVNLRDAFDRTNQAFDRFNEHITGMANHNEDAMHRLRHADDMAVEAERRFSNAGQHTTAIHNHMADKVDEDNQRMVTSSDQHINHLIHNDERLKSQLNSTGRTSEHISNRVTSANGRSARSFRYSTGGIHEHEQAIRNAQGRDYRWLRTAQDMSGATLGLGAAFYKGAKDATTLQQAYIHAGNMAHYGGEKVSQVQHDINNQWRVGSNLSVKYGISQDQIAKGYQALVARGYTTNESLHTQKSLLQASIASGDDYNDVVKDSTNVLDAYNMRSQNAATMTNNTKRVVNEMAYAADQTATNFRGLGIGMSYVAATAHTTHQPISETSSALGILSNKGMQASMAGVGLRKVLNSFLSVNKKGQQAQAMQQMGLSENDFKTASGHLKSLGALMTLMNNKTKNMDSQQRGAIFHRFFGATGQEAALNLASDTKGLAQLNTQVQKSQTMGSKQQGYVALLSQHNMKSAQNQFNKFKQAWQAFTITSARTILPEFTSALKHLDVWVDKLNDMSPRAKNWTIWSAIAIGAISPVSFAIFGVQSAFHGLEMTLLHVRHIFSKPVSGNMSKSMLKQEVEDDAGSKLLGDSGKSAGLSRVAKYDRGGIGYRALNLMKNAPWKTVGGVASATTLGVMMGKFMGDTAQNNAKKVHPHKSFGLPITDKIKAELTGSSVRDTISAGKNLNKQLQKQNKSTYDSVANQLKQYNSKQISSSQNNLKLLEHYHLISRKNAVSRLNSDKRVDKNRLTSATRAINQISKDDGKHSKDLPKDYANAYKAVNRLVAGNGSKQNQIYKKLEDSNYNISKTSARKLVANSYRTTSGEIKAANNSYKNTRNTAWKKYSAIKRAVIAEYGYRSNKYNQLFGKNGKEVKEYNHSVQNARNWRNAKVKVYKDEQKKVTKAASQESNSAIKDNGKMVTSWDITKRAFSSGANIISSSFGHVTASAGKLVGKLNILQHLSNWGRDIGNNVSHTINYATGISKSTLHNINSATDNAHSFGRAHATGGFITHNELSLVGEQGPEAAYNPRFNSFRMLGSNGPQVSEVYTGEHILNAVETRRLLTNGLGCGVILPGYADGTDTLENLRREHGTQMISKSHQNDVDQLNSFRNHVSSAGKTSNAIKDIIKLDPSKYTHFGLSGVGKGVMHSNDLFDVANAGLDLMGKGKMSNKIGHAGLDLGNAAGAAGIGTLIGGPIGTVVGAGIGLGAPWLESKLGINGHTVAKATHDSLNGIKHFGVNVGHGIRKFGRGVARYSGKAWRGLKHGAARGWHGLARLSRHALNGGKRLLGRAGHDIARFGRRTWSGAKRLGRRLWSGTKHVTGRMWSSAKRTGRNIWNSTKRVSKNIWSGSKHLARRISSTARSVWNRTKSGARRMATNVGHVTARLFREAKSKAHSAWSDIKSGARSAVAFGRHMIGGLVSAAHSAASHIRSLFSHIHLPHFATGGMIRRSTMALVGEHGPETAYNARNGSIRLLGTRGPQITTLLAGERVLTANQTSQLLHGGLGKGIKLPSFARGTSTELAMPSSRPSKFGIVGSFNGNNAIKQMVSFGKKAKSIWDDISDKITKISSDLSDSVNDVFKDMKHKVSGLSDDLKSGLIQAAKDTAEGFGDKFEKLITYAKDDMESVIEKLNRGVSGIDRALRAFGGNSHVIHPIHYATGTMNGRIAYNQLGILNDAISGPRQEAILRGNQVLMPQGNNVPVPLQKGDAVLNGDQTKQLINNTTNINHYAKGSGLHLSFKHLGGLIKTIGLALKGPAAFFKKEFNHFVGLPSGHQLTAGIEESGIHAIKPLGITWTRAMFHFIHSLLNPDSGGASASAFLNFAERHAPYDYTYGGAPGFNHTDCSGFVEACLRHFGISAPRTSGAQIAHFQHITRSEARAGDLLGTGLHIGIVADNGAHHYFSNHGGSSVHPASGMDPYVPNAFPGGPAKFARVPELASLNKPKHKKSVPFLQKLVSSELGSTAIHWLKKAAPLLSFGGDSEFDSTHIPGTSGAWTKQGSVANNIARSVFKAALSLGMNAKHAAALTGNAAHESARFGYGLHVHQFGGGPGVGLFQFNDPPHDMSPLGQDKAILANGLSPSAKSRWEHSSGSISGLTNSFEEIFERGGIPDNGLRDALAERAYGMFAANGGWADKNHMRIFGESGPEVAINPARGTADHLIVQAIAARIHHNSNSPMANLVKSMNIRKRGQALMNNVKDMLMSDHPSTNSRSQSSPISVHLSIGHINVNGASKGTSKIKLRHEIQKIAQDAIQRAALEARNRLSW